MTKILRRHLICKDHETKADSVIDRDSPPDNFRPPFEACRLDSGGDGRCALGDDGFLFLAHHLVQETLAHCCGRELSHRLPRGVLAVDYLAMAGLPSQHHPRTLGARARLPLGRFAGLYDWGRVHLLGV